MLAALVAALPFLAPLLKTGSLQAAKWIAGGILLLAIGGVGFALGYHWEESAFEAYKTKSATHELRLQKQYDQIGSELQARYEAEQRASEAETQRQLQELHSGNRSGVPAPKPEGHHRKAVSVAPVPDGGDSDRIVRLLRDIAGGKQ